MECKKWKVMSRVESRMVELWVLVDKKRFGII